MVNTALPGRMETFTMTIELRKQMFQKNTNNGIGEPLGFIGASVLPIELNKTV